MPFSSAEFRSQLQEASLLSPMQLQEFLSGTQADQSAEEQAQFLVTRESLTRFKARVLLQGSGQSLRLGSYVLLNRIGAGGMGQVYLGRHVTMKSQAAIKILPQNRGSQRHRARFQREIEVAAKLRHPNIVSAFDAGEDRGVCFLAMEYVPGTDLAAFVKKRGPVEPARAVDWTLQAAKGLQ